MAMDERKKRILQAIIDDYIQTAIPVGSRTITKKYDMGLSSATIRNEMSDLTDLGYLDQPHVSAGRIPSAKAYRMYVQELLQSGEISSGDAQALHEYFGDRMRQFEEVIEHAAQVISEMTRLTALVTMPKRQEMRIQRLQLVKVSSASALLVIVSDSGIVRNSVIRVSEQLDADALYAISRSLTERLSGHTLSDVQEMLVGLLRHARGSERVLAGVAELTGEMERQALAGQVMVGGSHKILSYPEYADIEKARSFLTLLEAKEQLMHLLESQGGMNFSVRIGSDAGLEGMDDVSVVTAAYQIGEDSRGVIGVIGPQRIDYSHVLSVLGAMGRFMTELFGEYGVNS